MKRMSFGAYAHQMSAEQLARRLSAGREPLPDWLGDHLLRPGQVAALFSVTRRTVADWARAGKLEPIVTPGGHRRFRLSEVQRVLQSAQFFDVL
jgi:excisionase family DNA binding protein